MFLMGNFNFVMADRLELAWGGDHPFGNPHFLTYMYLKSSYNVYRLTAEDKCHSEFPFSWLENITQTQGPILIEWNKLIKQKVNIF